MYTQISPATDWYFRHDKVEGGSIVYQLAVWALKEDGEVVGLVSVRNQKDGRAKLVSPPPVEGDYLHRDQLTDEELKASKTR